MTTSLIFRLRNAPREDCTHGGLLEEAADEIERLTADLMEQALVISRLNSGQELQRLMVENNNLVKALEAEREACAKVAEATYGGHNFASSLDTTARAAASHIAAAIRARGDD